MITEVVELHIMQTHLHCTYCIFTHTALTPINMENERCLNDVINIELPPASWNGFQWTNTHTH